MKNNKKMPIAIDTKGRGRPKLYGDTPITTAILLPCDTLIRLGKMARKAGVSRNRYMATILTREASR